MSTSYPSVIDNLTNPLPTDKLNNPSHASQHTNINDAMEAVQNYVGTSAGTPPGSITARVIDLELNGGGGSGGDATSVDGWSVEVVSVLPPVQDPNTIYFVEGGGGAYLPLTGGTMTGDISFNELAQTAFIGIVADPLSTTGEVFNVGSNAGTAVHGPYIVLDTTNLQMTMPGAQINAALTVAAIDSFGVVSLGYTTLPPPSYAVSNTTTIPVVIKAANAAVPTAWIATGLQVTLAQDIPAGTGNIQFEGVFSNPTVRTGTVEFGLRINGGTVNARDIVTQISANFNQTIAMALPMINAYVDGDVLELMARVTINDNNQFSLTMANSATDIGAMRIYTIPSGGSGGGGTVNSVGAVAPIASSGGSDPQISMPPATGTQSGYLTLTNWNTFNNKADPATSLAGYGITNAYTKTETDNLLSPKAPLASPVFTGNPTAPTASVGDNDTTIATTAFTVAEIANRAPSKTGTGATGSWNIASASATVATTVDDTNSASNKSIWTGTSAQYDAIGTKNNDTIYFVRS